jgi:hypothetical protein
MSPYGSNSYSMPEGECPEPEFLNFLRSPVEAYVAWLAVTTTLFVVLGRQDT